MKNLTLIVTLTLTLISINSVFSQNTVNAQVVGIATYGPQGNYLVPVPDPVKAGEIAHKVVGAIPDSMKYVLIIPVKGTGARLLNYEQVYGNAIRQDIQPCDKWVAEQFIVLDLPLNEKVYLLGRVDETTAFQDDGKPVEELFVPVINITGNGLSLGQELVGTLDEFELVADISENGEMEMRYDNLKYKWEYFDSGEAKIMVLVPEQRMR